MVEFVLVGVFLFLFLLSLMDWSWVFFVRHTMYQAARESARAMAVQEKTVAQAQTMIENLLDAVGDPSDFTINIVNTPTVRAISVQIAIPLSQARLVGLYPLPETSLQAQVLMDREGL